MAEVNELSEFQGIDFALSAHISKAFDSRINPNVGPKQFREFLGRAVNKQIYRNDADSPGAFIKSLRKSGQKKRIESDKTINLPDLPVVNYFRKPGITNDDQRQFRAQTQLYNDAEDNAFDLTAFPVLLTYTMWFMAWDKPSLDSMQMAWYAFVCDPTKKNKSFKVRYKIGTDFINDVDVRIRDRRAILFSDVSETTEGKRLYTVETTLELMTEILYGAEVQGIDEVEITGELAGYCHDWPRD